MPGPIMMMITDASCQWQNGKLVPVDISILSSTGPPEQHALQLWVTWSIALCITERSMLTSHGLVLQGT